MCRSMARSGGIGMIHLYTRGQCPDLEHVPSFLITIALSVHFFLLNKYTRSFCETN